MRHMAAALFRGGIDPKPEFLRITAQNRGLAVRLHETSSPTNLISKIPRSPSERSRPSDAFPNRMQSHAFIAQPVMLKTREQILMSCTNRSCASWLPVYSCGGQYFTMHHSFAW